MKKIFLVPFVFLSFINIFAWEYIKKYSYAEYYRAAESPEECGVSVYEVCIKTISENKETIRATIFHTLTLFSQYISQEVELKLKNDKYEFSFTDTYNNKGYGNFSSTLPFDCYHLHSILISQLNLFDFNKNSVFPS